MAFPRFNKNILFLGGAIVLGIVAALLSVSYLHQKIADATTNAQLDDTELEVIVSRRDLEIGEAIAESDMVTRNVPVDFVPADAITTSTYGQYVDRLVRSPIKRGLPLSANSLVPAHGKFSYVIDPGKVGYTLSVNENNSISGMIAPGDLVDILLVHKPGDDATHGGDSSERVVPLLESITVLATGSRVDDMPGGEGNVAFSSVTLELDPSQAQILTIGQKAGEVRVLLRNFRDSSPFGLSGLSEKSLIELFGKGGSDEVEFIIGGN